MSTVLIIMLLQATSIILAGDISRKEMKANNPRTANSPEAKMIHEMPIQTVKGYLVFIRFPSWDKIVRVDVGNQTHFGAEASKDYPNFLVLYQKGAGSRLQTNVTVLMESQHLFHFVIKGSDGKGPSDAPQKVYDLSSEYDVPEPAAVKTVALSKVEGEDALEKKLEKKIAERLLSIEAENGKLAERQARELVINSMRHDVNHYEKKENGDGITIYIHEIRPLDKLTFVSFTVQNNSTKAIELLEPRVTIDHVQKKKLRRQNRVPTERLNLQTGKIPPKGRAQGTIAFRADAIRDSNQSYVLNVARIDKADKTIKIKLF